VLDEVVGSLLYHDLVGLRAERARPELTFYLNPEVLGLALRVELASIAIAASIYEIDNPSRARLAFARLPMTLPD
jgi:hypothetical protein